MVLYLISVGLSVTMGLMGFVNLAHGVFAMLGGYVVTSLMNRYGVPFCRGARWRGGGHRARQRRRSSGCSTARSTAASDLDQVLLTMGLIFMSVAGGDLCLGTAGAADAPAALARRPDRSRLPQLSRAIAAF